VVKELAKETDCSIITNGTIPFPEFLKNVGFSVSVDGTEKSIIKLEEQRLLVLKSIKELKKM